MRNLDTELSIRRAGVGCQGGSGGELAGVASSAESSAFSTDCTAFKAEGTEGHCP